MEENLFYIGSNSYPNKRTKQVPFRDCSTVCYRNPRYKVLSERQYVRLGSLYWSYNRVSFHAMLKQNIQIWKINNAECKVGVAVIRTEWWHNTIYNKFAPPIPVRGSFRSIHYFMSGYLSRIKQLLLIPCSNSFQNLANT